MAKYSTYEAKAKFSEILRLVREGKTVYITYHGETVAEIRPIREPEGLSERLLRLREEGVLQGPAEDIAQWRMIARMPGALARFLSDRDDG